MTITNNNRLNAEPWCVPTFTSKHLLLSKTVQLQQFISIYTSIMHKKINITTKPKITAAVTSSANQGHSQVWVWGGGSYPPNVA